MTGSMISAEERAKRYAMIDTMLATPGIYAVKSTIFYWWCEVLPDGTCQQLKPDTFARDGLLTRNGWSPEGYVFGIFGPYTREEAMQVEALGGV